MQLGSEERIGEVGLIPAPSRMGLDVTVPNELTPILGWLDKVSAIFPARLSFNF